MSYKVGVVGAAGYAGAELVRLLLQHPSFELELITSDADAGKALTEVYPAFVGQTSLRFSKHDAPALMNCDIVFLAVPHTAAMNFAPSLLQHGISVVDLSADFRLNSPNTYETWYGTPHSAPELLATRAFGLPELFHSELETAQKCFVAGEPVLVGCAGCYPTATALAAFPAISAGWTKGLVVVDAKSGVSGAGKSCTARTHFCHTHENVEAYSVGTHRHTPEIEQILGKPDEVVFTPHLVPQKRGLLSTVYRQLNAETAPDTLEEVHAYYASFYKDCPFTEVLELGGLRTRAALLP